MNDFLSYFPWNPICFSFLDPYEICSEKTKVIQIAMETYIPHLVENHNLTTADPGVLSYVKRSESAKIEIKEI